MNVLGIVAEYDPFHNGHAYHLQKAREASGADATVAVMSGGFTQRGRPALADKWKRAEIAVDCGVDLVLELPFAFACGNAELFAKGAIRVLNGLGCVTDIAFGSESADRKALWTAAGFLFTESAGFRKALKDFSSAGMPYPAARHAAYAKYVGPEAAAVLARPNDILAVEYLKQIKINGSGMIPHVIRREGDGHDAMVPASDMTSASAIRGMLAQACDISPWVPAASYEKLAEALMLSAEPAVQIRRRQHMEERRFALCAMQILKNPDLAEICSATEGIENRLRSEVRRADSVDSLIGRVKTKRYAYTRIERLITHTMAGLTKADLACISEEELYARVLAMNQTGSRLLRYMRNTCCASIPILTNIERDTKAGISLSYDILASDLYNLIAGRGLYAGSDFVKVPYVKKP